MAQKSRNTNMPEMLNCKLSDEELQQFDAWISEKHFKFDNLVGETLLNDIKIGVSWDAYNDCFVASLTPKGERDSNNGMCLLSRATTWQEAIAMSIFKHVVIFGKGKWSKRNENNQRG